MSDLGRVPERSDGGILRAGRTRPDKYEIDNLKILTGILVAVGLVMIPAAATLTGIAAWKIALGVLGLVLFILGGRAAK
jgi:hypothetical protein